MLRESYTANAEKIGLRFRARVAELSCDYPGTRTCTDLFLVLFSLTKSVQSVTMATWCEPTSFLVRLKGQAGRLLGNVI